MYDKILHVRYFHNLPWFKQNWPTLNIVIRIIHLWLFSQCEIKKCEKVRKRWFKKRLYLNNFNINRPIWTFLHCIQFFLVTHNLWVLQFVWYISIPEFIIPAKEKSSECDWFFTLMNGNDWCTCKWLRTDCSKITENFILNGQSSKVEVPHSQSRFCYFSTI